MDNIIAYHFGLNIYNVFEDREAAEAWLLECEQDNHYFKTREFGNYIAELSNVKCYDPETGGYTKEQSNE